MKSIVIELQHDALDSKTSITDLLRKALVVARKLNLSDFESWINAELNGWPNYDDIPTYREVRGQVHALHAYQGWLPVLTTEAVIEEMITVRKMREPISEIERMSVGT